jgi:Zn-dependent protease
MLTTIFIILFVAVPAIVLHECAHGWAADTLGDTTARRMGRLTLNPLSHVDPVGTVAVPLGLYLLHYFGITHSLIMFGWARPVPVNFAALRDPKRDMALVGAAGPVVNILIALVLTQFIRLGVLPAAHEMFFWGVMLNMSLAVFNLVPVPPLDGSRIVAAFLPSGLLRGYYALEPFGIIMVLVAVQFGWLDFLSPLILAMTRGMGLS